MSNDTKLKDGNLDLKHGYSIIKVVYHSMGDKFIPYIVGCVVEGPKGGKYMLDAFGIQYLFRIFNIRAQQGTLCRLLDSKGNVRVTSPLITLDKDLSTGKTNEECSIKYAKSHGYKYIQRRDVQIFMHKLMK